MAGPFPGMDPYLESPALWPGVHQRVITGLGAALNALLPAGYVADIGERVYIARPDRIVYPDVVVFGDAFPLPPAPSGRHSAVALADPPMLLTVEPSEIREVYIEIRPSGDESRVVTAIEVLSFSNKMGGNEGRGLYLRKQQEILGSAVSLIEIDLLRVGDHTVSAPQTELDRQGRFDYLACLHRGGTGGRFELWLRTVRDRLPRILVPLDAGAPDVVLDLQAVFDRNYEEGAYARRIDYRREPPIPLGAADAAWANALLRDNGLRTAAP